VKNVVHSRHFFRQLQLIRYFTSAAEDLERSHIARCKLSFQLKPLHPFQGGYFEIDEVSDLKGHLPTSLVGVALLSGLRSLEVLTDLVNLLFGFTKNVWAENLTLSDF
jgi:hypothetical protein